MPAISPTPAPTPEPGSFRPDSILFLASSFIRDKAVDRLLVEEVEARAGIAWGVLEQGYHMFSTYPHLLLYL
jgi:hypothetical protein